MLELGLGSLSSGSEGDTSIAERHDGAHGGNILQDVRNVKKTI